MYIYIKYAHLLCVCLTILGFLGRGFFILKTRQPPSTAWIRISPHVVDALLLVTGLFMTLELTTSEADVSLSWLHVKLLLVVAYIVVGIFALRRYYSVLLNVLLILCASAMYGLVVYLALAKPQF